MSMSTPALLPCPFCGGSAEVVTYDGREVSSDEVRISCTKCQASTRNVDAGNSWNSGGRKHIAILKVAGIWNQRTGDVNHGTK
jgi:hypothetical protein